MSKPERLVKRMIKDNTPVEDYREKYGLLVKREDLCCPPPGPSFSKTRGVFAHIAARPEKVIGVLDTHHSQGGHAVAAACRLLGKQCVNFFPIRKADIHKPLQSQQEASEILGAKLVPLQAGRSAILYHAARKMLPDVYGPDCYMMPNALKLPEMVYETAIEARRTYQSVYSDFGPINNVIISISSGTIAAGVIEGLCEAAIVMIERLPHFILHQGYDRSSEAVFKYLASCTPLFNPRRASITLINEGYSYGDRAVAGPDPKWPCNQFYDLKAFRWWLREGRGQYSGQTLFWNIG